jgi:glutamine synthetase
VGYDGSSGLGLQPASRAGDVGRPTRTVDTAFVDPFCARPTLSSLVCVTPFTADTKEPFAISIRPRPARNRAAAYLRQTGIADEAWMGPEFEFNVLDRVAVQNTPFYTGVEIECGETDGPGIALPTKGGYMRVPPSEHLHDLRSEIVLTLEQMGVPIRYHHHEVGAAGQCEIEINLCPLVQAADRAMLIKYVIKNVCQRRGKLATFMPKPIYGEAGNGMHVHQKLLKGERNVFYDDGQKNYAHLSDMALQYVSGLLAHGQGLTGLTNPSTNSFKRLVEGYEAPVNLFFSLANRSAAIRVPKYANAPQYKRIEYRPPDFTGNIYLTLAAMVMAGIDGVQRKLDPGKENFGPFDVDIAAQSADFRDRITALPRSLQDALDALRHDHDYLLAGDVFDAGFIHGWIESKVIEEARVMKARPHPYEYELYLDV